AAMTTSRSWIRPLKLWTVFSAPAWTPSSSATPWSYVRARPKFPRSRIGPARKRLQAPLKARGWKRSRVDPILDSLEYGDPFVTQDVWRLVELAYDEIFDRQRSSPARCLPYTAGATPSSSFNQRTTGRKRCVQCISPDTRGVFQ